MSQVAGPSDFLDPRKATNKIRTKRTPSKLLPVIKRSKDGVWDTLLLTDAELTVADWLAMNKFTSKDIKGEFYYLHGLKKNLIPPINLVKNNKNTDIETDTYISTKFKTDTDTKTSTDINADNNTYKEFDSMEDDIGSENYINGSNRYKSAQEYSDDITYNYKSNFNNFSVSQPLKASIMINNYIISVIFDSDASVSIIGKT
ncbi:hypothetical protein J3Q64DRAFT_1827525 [Phycomyces blakesleeanus]|uniref:Uncharacterized protein n=1 Tax=Phycomyces blakesleeanus TaxID=4837 RepID=A0ABR3BC79_PHYBL